MLAIGASPARRHIRTGLGLVLLCVAASGARVAAALDPDSPDVRAAISRGLGYLQSADDPRLGAKALMGLAFLKNGATADHPKVVDAVNNVKAATAVGAENFQYDIYSTGVSMLLLVAVDPSKYRSELEVLARSLHLRVKDHGAWGYPVNSPNDLGKTCDTSMTQYAVLGLWEAEDLAGVVTPPDVWQRAGEWLLTTQDPGGGYGYQGKPSNKVGKRVKQDGVKHSMTAAGLGALYIVKDRLGFRRLKKTRDEALPAALRPVIEEPPADDEAGLVARDFYRGIQAGNGWIEERYSIAQIDKEKDWFYYSLYALERYYSLREADEAEDEDSVRKSPSWYNQGAKVLIDAQQPDGSWKSVAGEVPDTCFAVLFLLRSTRKTLEKASAARHAAGQMQGGVGFPGGPAARVRDAQVTVVPLAASLDEVLAVLGQPQHPSFAAAVETLADQARDGDPQELSARAEVLAQLAATAPLPARLVAIFALARSRNLDQAPLLIHLLRDADLPVVRAASDALAQISRKYTDFGLGAEPTADRRERAIIEWTAWYRTIRPDVDIESFALGGGAP
jgi:hypothetical protein